VNTCTFQVSAVVIVNDISIYFISMLDFVSKVGSVCTVLTNNCCEDAYNLLQSLDIKKLLVRALCCMYPLCKLMPPDDCAL
jgi:hypothetical protein